MLMLCTVSGTCITQVMELAIHLRLAVYMILKWCLSLLMRLLTSLFLIKILIVWSKRPSSSFPGVCQIASDTFSVFSLICIFLTI